MTTETENQEAHDADFLRHNPICTHCKRRHPRSASPCAFWYPSLTPKPPVPNIIIEIEGGLVARVLSDRPVNVTIVDTDIEGNGVEDATEDVYRVAPASIPDDGQNYDLAMVSWPAAEVNSAVVSAYLARIAEATEA